MPSPVTLEPKLHPVLLPLPSPQPEAEPPLSSPHCPDSHWDPQRATGPARSCLEPGWHREESGGSIRHFGGGSTGCGLGPSGAGLGLGMQHGAGQGLWVVAPQESCPAHGQQLPLWRHRAWGRYHCCSPGVQTRDAWGHAGPEAAHARVPRRSQPTLSLSCGVQGC